MNSLHGIVIRQDRLGREAETADVVMWCSSVAVCVARLPTQRGKREDYTGNSHKHQGEISVLS